jgi:predicted nuclease of predicted toxin-antitoxin system
MRLLFDEQLSEELIDALAGEFPDSQHVRFLNLGGAPDVRVWEIARDRGWLLVTKDEDFCRLVLLRGAPPKVVWIRLGNCPTSAIADLLRDNRQAIVRFAEQGEVTILELG